MRFRLSCLLLAAALATQFAYGQALPSISSPRYPPATVSAPAPPAPVLLRPSPEQLKREQRGLAKPTAPYDATMPSDMMVKVAVSDSSTTYLVFPEGVSLVDVGMLNNYLVKIENNAVFVRARRPGAPPTPIMVRHGARYWLGQIVYVKSPVMMLYDFQKGGNMAPNGDGTYGPRHYGQARYEPGPYSYLGQTPAPGGEGASGPQMPENELALDKEAEKKVRVDSRLSLLNRQGEDHHAVAVLDNDLVLSLANVRNDKDFTYFRFKLVNGTAIDYNVDFCDFQLVENSQGRLFSKKKNEARRALVAVGGRPNQTIAGNTTGYLLYAVPLFAATNQGHLAVLLREKFGARALALNLPSRLINQAPSLRLN
ncbi:DUF4138 domain-containing protein (plasmid) [Hymenobacter sp. BRD128]|uniref:DUF4138 domain-containing protein n=1 Tax=Hymenobacter sp. BRD128 TaxID=2675878 RepID=UPI0015656055|nr:DUF4138 domain-containing protein [Hymenobacter sp. BRD128]QKG59059.1 DUF4138 domain-containing protein [Hymenobacter sp. BRD128]